MNKKVTIRNDINNTPSPTKTKKGKFSTTDDGEYLGIHKGYIYEIVNGEIVRYKRKS